MYKIENNKITIVRGDTATFDIDLKTEENGDIEDYTPVEGDVCVFKVKKNVNDKVILIEKTGFTVSLDEDDTKDLPFGKYYYDVKFTSADETVKDHPITVNDFVVAEAL